MVENNENSRNFPIHVYAKEDGSYIGMGHVKPKRFNGTKMLELVIIPVREYNHYYHIAVTMKIPNPPLKSEEMTKITLEGVKKVCDTNIDDYEKLLDNYIRESDYQKNKQILEEWGYEYDEIKNKLHEYMQIDNMIAIIKYTSTISPDDELRLKHRKEHLRQILIKYGVIEYIKPNKKEK